MKKKEWTKNWFSNMFEFDQPFVYQGIAYFTVENFYQAMKFADKEERRHVASLEPHKAKRYARGKAPDFWNGVKLHIMEIGLREKFAQGTSWHKKLMETGDKDIVEWNNWGDTYWGKDIRTGLGTNHLGELLMKIRKEFQDDEVSSKRTNRKSSGRQTRGARQTS